MRERNSHRQRLGGNEVRVSNVIRCTEDFTRPIARLCQTPIRWGTIALTKVKGFRSDLCCVTATVCEGLHFMPALCLQAGRSKAVCRLA